MNMPVNMPVVPALSTRGPVLIVGTGLLGTSLALALSAARIEVQLADTSPTSLALARDMGAGRVRTSGDAEPRIVVVAEQPQEPDTTLACFVVET